jgi:hypothetical protein
MSAGDWIALGSLLSVVLSGAYGLWRASRADDRATEDRQARAIEAAVAAITADRDYWRAKADRIEERQRRD